MFRKPIHFLRHQLTVRALALHQAIRRAVFDDVTSFQQHHPIEITQRRETMGDRNHGAPAHQAGERLAYRFFGFAVKRGGRLIEERGRREAPGRPILYGTTWEFLECFGLSSLDELPRALTPEGVIPGLGDPVVDSRA